ncbi:MAG TPA: hypothetical protein PKK96_14730 [Anaerolineales bacterium]|nr:hypothetical protein [Anaerolineales bacterium]HNQ94676.1 hypothetical protein [Anaerolineales bacterium]HNS62255.1 hypothetical protein [Anaerolineales bacterium]
MNRNIALRVVSGLVLFAVIAAIGFFAFQAGVAQGSPITIEAPSGESAPAPYPHYGYGYGMRPHHPFGFGFGCLFPIFGILLFILAFKSFRVMMWGPRWGWGGRHGWGEHGVPPMFDEWHKKAHGESTEEKKE